MFLKTSSHSRNRQTGSPGSLMKIGPECPINFFMLFSLFVYPIVSLFGTFIRVALD